MNGRQRTDSERSQDFSFSFHCVERVSELCTSILEHGIDSHEHEELKNLGLALKQATSELRSIEAALRREVLRRFGL